MRPAIQKTYSTGTSTNCCAPTRRRLLARNRALLLAVVTAALFIAVAPQNAGAQTAPTITAGSVDNNFPDGIVFHASAAASETITDVRLRYEILPDGTSASAKP